MNWWLRLIGGLDKLYLWKYWNTFKCVCVLDWMVVVKKLFLKFRKLRVGAGNIKKKLLVSESIVNIDQYRWVEGCKRWEMREKRMNFTWTSEHV